MGSVGIDATTSAVEAVAVTQNWVAEHVPAAWRAAAADGPAAIRAVRSPEEYREWYPVFAGAGFVVPGWAPAYGGLGVGAEVADAIASVLAPYRLHRLNPLGLNNTAAALLAHGTEEQRLRFLPPIVRNEERWCQLFSEPGAGSDLASLACRAERDGDEWVITGQKVWTTWADESEFAILLARTDPDLPKHKGITYFLLDLRQPGVEVRPLRQLTGEAEFNEVFMTEARAPDFHRVGDVNDGWRVSAATLASERNMVAGSGASGGVERLGGSSSATLLETTRSSPLWSDPVARDRVVGLWAEERVRNWTNGRAVHASLGKVHQATLNQRIQVAFVDLLGAAATAWEGGGLRPEVQGMLRSLANSIEGGTTEVNKNILGERVLGLPREPDPWHGQPWRTVPRS